MLLKYMKFLDFILVREILLLACSKRHRLDFGKKSLSHLTIPLTIKPFGVGIKTTVDTNPPELPASSKLDYSSSFCFKQNNSMMLGFLTLAPDVPLMI